MTAAEFAYTGKDIKPGISPIVDTDGTIIGTDCYTVTYPASSGTIGAHNVVVTFKGRYTGTYQLQYTVKAGSSTSASSVSLSSVSLKKVKRAKKSFTATWSKSGDAITGYQIEYSLKKNFSKAKYKNVTNSGKTSLTGALLLEV